MGHPFIVGRKPTRANDGSHLYNHVVGCGSNGPLFHVERVFANPCGNNRMEIRISILLSSAYPTYRIELKEEISQPDIMVVMVNLPQSSPWDGRANRAANSGRTQNSPNMQCNVRSLKNSLLYAKRSIKIICNTAEGIDSMLLLNVENPMRRRVRDR